MGETNPTIVSGATLPRRRGYQSSFGCRHAVGPSTHRLVPWLQAVHGRGGSSAKSKYFSMISDNLDSYYCVQLAVASQQQRKRPAQRRDFIGELGRECPTQQDRYVTIESAL